jgi:hypothetical protein
MPQQIIINTCYGGFSISREAIDLYNHYAGFDAVTSPYAQRDEYHRDDPMLVRVVRELGERANGDHAQLKIVTIPDDVDWILEEYDGIEWIAERHRTWE